MNELERVKSVVKWLIFKDYANNEGELAEKLGYNNSYLSQILNEKTPLSEKFVDNLASIDNSINVEWILTGEGEMIIENNMKTNGKAIERFDEYMRQVRLNDNKVTKELGLSIGLLGKCRKENRDLSRELIDKILLKYTDLSDVYLKTGKGDIFVNKRNLTPMQNISDDSEMYKRLYELQVELFMEVKKDRDRLQAILDATTHHSS